MPKADNLQSRRRIVHESDVAETMQGQIQDRISPPTSPRQKMNLRLPGRYYRLLDTVSARRAARPSRNALVGEAVEMLLRGEGVL